MEEMTGDEIIKLTRDAYTLSAEVFNFFHNTVKKTAKPKVTFTDPALTNETLDQSEKKTTHATNAKTKVKAGNSSSELGDISTKTPTTSSKNAKKERRKMKVQERELVEAGSESSKSDKEDTTIDQAEEKTIKVNEPLTTQDFTGHLGAMSISGPETTPKKAKKKKRKKY